jgi:hypothetical protein
MPIPVKRLIPLLLVFLLTCPALPAEEPTRNIRFGMPSPATADPENREDYLIARPHYAKLGQLVPAQGRHRQSGTGTI